MWAICLTCCAKALYGLLAPYGVERPRITRPPWSATSCDSSSDSRVLPIPDGPKTVTNCARRSSTTRFQAPVSTPSSRSRPTSGTAGTARSPAPVLGRRLLALGGQRLRRPVLDRRARGVVGLLADQHRPARCGRLQTGGRVDDVAGDHRFAVRRPRLEVDERLAGVNGDPHLQAVRLR